MSAIVDQHVARLKSLAVALEQEIQAFKRHSSGQFPASVPYIPSSELEEEGPKTDPALTMAKLPPVHPGMSEQEVVGAFTMLASALASAEALALALGRHVDVHSKGGST